MILTSNAADGQRQVRRYHPPSRYADLRVFRVPQPTRVPDLRCAARACGAPTANFSLVHQKIPLGTDEFEPSGQSYA